MACSGTELKYENKKIPHCQNSFKILSNNRRQRRNFDTPNTHIHGRSLLWHCTGTLMKHGRVKPVVVNI